MRSNPDFGESKRTTDPPREGGRFKRTDRTAVDTEIWPKVHLPSGSSGDSVRHGKDTYGPLTLHALWGPSVHTGFALGQTVGAVTVGDQLHLLHTSYEPTSGLLGEASSLLNAALRESPARDPKPASAKLATQE
jgi:hypothetical protein